MAMADFFVYGTLMCFDIIKAVTGFVPFSKKGVVRGYRRLRIKKGHYPGLYTARGFEVDGLVYSNIFHKSGLILDRFEGKIYARRSLQVFLEDGAKMEAYAYVVRPEYFDRLDDKDWDFVEFLNNEKDDFASSYSGYNAIKQGSE